MECIGEDVTRELEYQPAKLEAHIHVRPKYACRRCKDGVSAAPLPARPIPGGIAGPGLITEVFVGKFGDHLPLYRLEDILARYGVYLSRSTLCGWMKAVAYLLRPLYELQRQRVLQSSVMWTDDTHVTVLGGAEGSFKGYFWTYIGDAQAPLLGVRLHQQSQLVMARHVFSKNIQATYTPMRIRATTRCFWTSARMSSKLPVGRMRGASSSMRCEAIHVKHTKCWSGSGNSMTSKTGHMTCRSTRAASCALAQAIPVLDKIETYLASLAPRALPKSTLGKAVTYARNQWEALRRYTEDGRLTIDNNVSERRRSHGLHLSRV